MVGVGVGVCVCAHANLVYAHILESRVTRLSN
jgi:hypothetical protein